MTSFAMNISFWLYMLAAIATVLIGLLYASRRTVMPYHLEALETSWDEIDAKYQFLLKALLNGGGFFGLANGLFMLVILLIPFRQGELWAGYAVGFIGLVGCLPLGFIVHAVEKNTAGNPPLGVMVFVNGLLITGLVCFALAG